MKPNKKQSAGNRRASRPQANPVPAIHLRDLSRSLPMALMRAREAVMMYFRPHHREHGITEQQWRVLRVLHKSGEIEIADLARETVLLAPSLSRILRDLVAAKMVNRRPVEHDLRRSLVSIGPAGVTLLAKVAPLSEASFSTIAERFGAQRLNELFGLLNELEEALDRSEPTASRRTAAASKRNRVRNDPQADRESA
ncbi:MAG TPA: homoprotocatechuate degradation operon regulator HpaR [Povalibacter sp.]|nr:homoprotocatechuate degradation operon regulator HpaR [Povalibacter sp.]